MFGDAMPWSAVGSTAGQAFAMIWSSLLSSSDFWLALSHLLQYLVNTLLCTAGDSCDLKEIFPVLRFILVMAFCPRTRSSQSDWWVESSEFVNTWKPIFYFGEKPRVKVFINNFIIFQLCLLRCKYCSFLFRVCGVILSLGSRGRGIHWPRHPCHPGNGWQNREQAHREGRKSQHHPRIRWSCKGRRKKPRCVEMYG